ncbi:MAG: response regulator [Oleibacter sp.]|nr:response regulator [Thalassolituus sp.]
MSSNDNKGVVLVVDDSADSLSFMNQALASAGYTVLVAMDGVQAINIVRKMPPDLILLDAIMPNKDGFETCIELKADPDLQDIPIIFLTGLSDSDDVIRGLEAGGVDFLNKPVNLDVMMARVQVHINNAQKTKSARLALEEMAQPAFASDINGNVMWMTRCAADILSKYQVGDAEFHQQLQSTLPSWLLRHPRRNDQVRLSMTALQVQVRFLGRTAPDEFLLRLVYEDEESQRAVLRREYNLTDREAEVLLWLSRGKTNQEIGQILSLSPRTVNKHLEPIFRKLNVENRTSAVALALGALVEQ